MAILKITFFLLLLVVSSFAQFNEFKYEESKDSIITEQQPIVLSNSVVRKDNTKKKYVSNFVFAGSGLEGSPIRSSVYKTLDVVFIAGAIASYYQSNQTVENYKGFAAEHASVYPNNESLVSSMTRTQSLKSVNGKDGYNTVLFKNNLQGDMIDETEGNIWLWDSEENRERYQEIVSEEKKYSNQMYIFIGGLLLNRVVSSIDIAISSKKMRMVPSATSSSVGIQLQGDI